jgi:CPA1 family monovalent cation:H+ antiporter
MDLFDVAAVLVTLAALLGYVNYRFLRLPPSSGILALSLAGSVLLVGVNELVPRWGLRLEAGWFLGQIDFTNTLMRGMLCFLLFAGALQVDLKSLRANGWIVFLLATIGVVISTGVIGLLMSVVFAALGLKIPLLLCLVLGALISPTDPIAVLSLLKYLKAPRDLEAQIAGESLFNDGIGVVVFFAMISLAGLDEAGAPGHLSLAAGSVAWFFCRQVIGGAMLGLLVSYLACRGMKIVNSHPLELLISLAMAMLTYSLALACQVSGPIAVVVAGLFLGSYGRQFALSEFALEHVDAFWVMMDEILNSTLFLLLGLEVLTIGWNGALIGAGLVAIPIVLLARWISVALPIGLLGQAHRFHRGIVPILTWGGLRGALSVAMVLSLPKFPAKELFVSCTYLVMLFSVLVQGLSMERLLVHYGIGSEKNDRKN